MTDDHDRRSVARYNLPEPGFATLRPGNITARIMNLTFEGMALQYITPDDQPHALEEIVMLVDGNAYTARDFDIIHDREIRRAGNNGHRLREVGIRFRNEPVMEWLWT